MLKVGDRFQTTKDGEIVVIELLKNSFVIVEFVNSGNRCEVKASNIYNKASKGGGVMVADWLERDRVIKIKEELKTQAKIELKEYRDRLSKIKIVKTKPLKSADIDGLLKHRYERIISLQKYVKCAVKELDSLYKQHSIEYEKLYRAHVKAEVGYVTKSTIYDVIDDEGNFAISLFSTITLSNRLWRSIEARTSGKYSNIYPSYAGCRNYFKNYQSFCEWCQCQEFYGREGYELDKDILGDGMTYSEDYCAFIPVGLNLTYARYEEHGMTDVIRNSLTLYSESKDVPKRVREKLISILS